MVIRMPGGSMMTQVLESYCCKQVGDCCWLTACGSQILEALNLDYDQRIEVILVPCVPFSVYGVAKLALIFLTFQSMTVGFHLGLLALISAAQQPWRNRLHGFTAAILLCIPDNAIKCLTCSLSLHSSEPMYV